MKDVMNDEGLNFTSLATLGIAFAWLWKRGLAFEAGIHWPSTLLVIAALAGLAGICVIAHRTGR